MKQKRRLPTRVELPVKSDLESGNNATCSTFTYGTTRNKGENNRPN